MTIKYNDIINALSPLLVEQLRNLFFKIKKYFGFDKSCSSLEKLFDPLESGIILYFSGLCGVDDSDPYEYLHLLLNTFFVYIIN